MEMPAGVVGTVGLNEVVTHGWDLARGTGQPFEVDGATVDACLEFLGPISQPGMEAARKPAFGPGRTSSATIRDVTPTDVAQAEARLNRGLADLNVAEANYAISQAVYAQVIGQT